MKNILLTMLVVVLAFAKAQSQQILINELDADVPGTDFEEFIELRTQTPFESLDGYIMVLFNGSSSTTSGQGRSYYVEDLDGLTTDNNGLVVLGSSQVRPSVDRLLIDGNTFQNGADAVGIYLGEPDDFPDKTFATTNNLVDALVYGTNDPDNQELLTLLNQPAQYNEGPNNNSNSSLQRKADGTFEAKAPTPHSLNDSPEPTFIGIDFVVNTTDDLREGDSFTITFNLTKPADQDLNIDFSLVNRSFTTADFTGATSISIPEGGTSQTLNFTIVEDNVNDGDEFLRVNLGNDLPVGYKRLRDNELFLVIDNDFTAAAYGTPLNPTYGIVASTAPDDYYDELDGLASPELDQAITALIAETGVVREHTYADVTTILESADVSPLNSNNVWLMYNEIERRKIDFQDGSNGTGKWNREHIFPRSRGGFFSIEEDEIPDGINVFVETSVDSVRHGNSDAHHLRATDANTNSSRGNDNYGETSGLYNGPAGNQGSWHGDVARAAFYIALRYRGLEVVNGNPASNMDQLGDLETLLEWHRQDPPDDFEMNRNNVVFEWQINRNPFIDNPELVELIFGDQQGDTFTLSNAGQELNSIAVFPNPSSGILNFRNIDQPVNVNVYDALGRNALTTTLDRDGQIQHNLASGFYVLQMTTFNGNSRSYKLIVE
jgi:hypothetical protein